jgi:Leishmanolysin
VNTLTATVSGAGFTDNPVIFQAAGCVGGGRPAFDVTLCYTSPVTNAQRAVFAGAAARWQSLVVGGLDDLHVDQPLGFCGAWVPALNLVVDDLLIFAGIDGMDGGGGILGTAGPCWVRAGDLLPAVGVMRFDAADLELLEAYGDLGPVVLHEMGHVLGIGTLWPHLGLLRNPSSTASRLDTYFAGDRALSAFNRLGGVGYASGQKVPVENFGGAGTVNGHWRESVLVNELMTGYLNIGPNPLSEITVRSLADMGYVVDPAAADPFFRTMTLRNGDGPEPGALPLNDAWTGPLYRADPRGAVTRIR